jgi:hypothetical protein
VADTKVGAVHVARNDEDHCDRQVVVGHIRQLEGLCLGMESAQKGQNRSSGTLDRAKHMVRRIGVLGIGSPISREKRPQSSGMRWSGEKVIPADMLPPEIREWQHGPGAQSRPGS